MEGLQTEVPWRVAPFGLQYISPRFGTADDQINVTEKIFLKFLFDFFLAGREGTSSRISQPEGVYFYERERVSA